MSAAVARAPSISSNTSANMPVTPKRKAKSARKGGFFGCRSKSALDSLPRNARGSNAAIHRLHAQDVFGEDGLKVASCASLTSTVHDKEKTMTATKETKDVYEDEARDVLPDTVNTTIHSSSIAPVRSNSTGGMFRRSLSLKRSGSTATANLVQRAPPVSSTDFAPANTSANDDKASSAGEEGAAKLKGDMASIRQARGQHLSASAAAATSQSLFPDITEDEYIGLTDVPVPPSFIPIPSLPPAAPVEEPVTPAKRINAQRQKLTLSTLPESDSMRAVARALGDDSGIHAYDGTTFIFQPGPSTGTPRLEAASPSTTASIAEVEHRRNSSELGGDELAPLPTSAPPASGGFWDNHTDKEDVNGPASNPKFVPFQYMTNITRPVSIASFRSLASPYTPPRTSSRNANIPPVQRPNFSPLATQGTFNGFPAGYFPAASTPERPKANIGSPKIEQQSGADTSMDDVEAQLGFTDQRREPSQEEDFADFAAKGKASRRTTIKKPTTGTSLGAPLYDATNTISESNNDATEQKKMVPGPAGNYITDTANMRWCSALDEIKKALASTSEEIQEDDAPSDRQGDKYLKLENHIDELLGEADAVLTKLGVEV